MAETLYTNTNLLSTSTLIETPYINVKIGEYEFGVYDDFTTNKRTIKNIKHFPNYVTELTITKINGQINTYTLTMKYQVTEDDDPNFFEKVFSSVSDTRKIYFTYGDMSAPSYVYKNEEAIITKITSQFSVQSSLITYNITATGVGNLANSQTFLFEDKYVKPSEEIKRLLNENDTYGLLDIFPGMRNANYLLNNDLIPNDDVRVDIHSDRLTVLDYLKKLVASMKNVDWHKNVSQMYVLSFDDDTSGKYGGAYFKITMVDKNVVNPDAYEINIGFPEQTSIISFDMDDDVNYSLLYNYSEKINNNKLVSRIAPDGSTYEVYSPAISNIYDDYITTEADKTWWSKITQYPIKASIVMRGLLRPATLMQYVRLNVYYYGRKHISSGLYIVTKQEDKINESGYQTTLNLTRVGADEDIDG